MKQQTTTQPSSSGPMWQRLEACVREQVQQFIQALLEEEITKVYGPLSAVSFHYRIGQPVMQARGLSYRKPHTLRHTYASLLLADGVSMTYG